MARPSIEAVTAETLPEFATFLQDNMGHPRSAADWISGLQTQWAGERPNYGFVLRDEGRIVGGIGAFYAERPIRGKLERFCNITSWCVLESHRKWSMPLAMAVVSQPGYHFTDFSPTKVVGGVLQFLKFKPLDEGVVVIPNFPASPWRGQIVATPAGIEHTLSSEMVTVWRDHAAFPWLRHVLVGTPGDWCHLIYKRGSFKGLPCARIVYLSHPELFQRHWGRLAWHFLGRGLASTHVERRFLTALPAFSRLRTGFNAKLYLSQTLGDADIDYLYSESVALDL